jgi:hypothetical protein
MKTKRDYEEWLNELGAPEDDKRSNGGRVPDNCKYGSWLRRNDPIAFQVGFNEWQQNTSQRRGKTPAERSKKMKNEDDRFELYKLALKKVKEAGYPVTKNRVWDQFVSIAFRCGLRECLKPHDSEPYFQRLGL